jgi:hypothetical protein
MSSQAAPLFKSSQPFFVHIFDDVVRRLSVGIAIAMLTFATGANAAPAKEGDTAYFCEIATGRQWSLVPCSEIGGTEIDRSYVLNSGGMIAPLPSKEPGADRPPAAVSGKAIGDAFEPVIRASEAQVAAENADASKQWRKSMLRWLGFAFVFAIIAKLTGRSFIRWFIVGAGVHFLLVALNVFSI